MRLLAAGNRRASLLIQIRERAIQIDADLGRRLFPARLLSNGARSAAAGSISSTLASRLNAASNRCSRTRCAPLRAA